MLRRCRPLLGTLVEVAAEDVEAIEAAFAAVGRVHDLMSAHEPGSDVSRINCLAHLRAVEVHDWTARVLERALFWSRESEGAFDVIRAGHAAIARGLIPIHPGQPAPRATHWTWLEIQGSAIRLHRSGCIDLGGIAKGFAVDRAIDALRAAGSAYGMVNAGGDVAGYGQAWPARIVEPRERRPLAEVALDGEALATSALIEGRFDHLPGADRRWISASVRARTAMDSDALTKVLLAGSALTQHCLDLADAKGLRVAADGSVEPVECVPA